MPFNYISVASKLVEWYSHNKRDLPWRNTSDPYKIWVSEIMLQQTTVRQGLPYYQRFIARFPDVFSLASAPEDEILKLWEGLGYYSRARNMHYSAQLICQEMAGSFPKEYKAIKSLKGVGDYTAAAIASIAFGLSYPVVDGNVIRVISRLLNIKEPVDTKEVLNKIYDASGLLINGQPPSEYNQAIMELGALVCTPKSPKCDNCPVSSFCEAYKLGTVSSIPIKSKKIKKRARFFNYFIIESNGKIILQKRTEKDIWNGLYQFPLLEVEKSDFISEPKAYPLNFETPPNIEFDSRVYKQTLTHQHIHARFYHLNGPLPKLPPPYILVNKVTLSGYAFPKVIDLYLNDKSIPLF